MLVEEIKRLKRRRNYLTEIQRNCSHTWNNSVYDPEFNEVMEWVPDDYIGSECFYVQVPTGKVQITDRWYRTCQKCGFKEYTYKSDNMKLTKIPRF